MKSRCLWLAGGLGFEPRLTESESAVLPLNYPPIVREIRPPPGLLSRISAQHLQLARRARPQHPPAMHTRMGNPSSMVRFCLSAGLWQICHNGEGAPGLFSRQILRIGE